MLSKKIYLKVKLFVEENIYNLCRCFLVSSVTVSTCLGSLEGNKFKTNSSARVRKHYAFKIKERIVHIPSFLFENGIPTFVFFLGERNRSLNQITIGEAKKQRLQLDRTKYDDRSQMHSGCRIQEKSATIN